MKICSKCKDNLDKNCFTKSQYKLIAGMCKSCVKNYNEIYRNKNSDIIKQKQKDYYQNNKECIRKRQIEYRASNSDKIKILNEKYRNNNSNYNKLYRQKNKNILKEKKRIYVKNKYHSDISFKLRIIISRSISLFLNKNGSSKNNKSCKKYLPYSIEELKKHLEKQFESWMNWNNQGRYNSKTWDDNDSTTWTWQIDHIIPQSSFKYASMEDQSFKDCWSLDNLRPLSSKQNNLKGNKI